MNIVFLDVDGVLTNAQNWKKRYEYWQKYGDWISEFDEENIKILSIIIKETNAKAVLSSSCRGDWKDGINYLKLDASKRLQRLFDKHNIEVVGITPTIARTNNFDEKYTSWRENEIKYYLNVHNEIDHFCVIDDEIFDLYTLKDYLVKTEAQYGLQEEHIENAIKILRKPIKFNSKEFLL